MLSDPVLQFHTVSRVIAGIICTEGKVEGD